MSGNGKPDDKIDEAIRQSQAIEMAKLDFTLDRGRPAVVQIPADLSETELLGIIAVIPQWYAQVQAQRKAQEPANRLWKPGAQN